MRTADPKAPTKEKILDAGMKLMLSKGYTATSLDDILSAAGATKGSFFHFFESKEALARALADRFYCGQMAMFEACAFQQERDPRARTLGWIDAVIAAFEDPIIPKSCLIGNFTQELAPTDPAMRALCESKFDDTAARFASDAKAALAAAGSKEDPADLAYYLLSVIQGSLILMKAKGDVAVGVRNLRRFRRHVESLIKVK